MLSLRDGSRVVCSAWKSPRRSVLRERQQSFLDRVGIPGSGLRGRKSRNPHRDSVAHRRRSSIASRRASSTSSGRSGRAISSFSTRRRRSTASWWTTCLTRVHFEETVGQLVAVLLKGHPDRTLIRAYGEMVDVLWKQGRIEATIRLEMLWNKLANRYGIALLCGYAVGNFDKRPRLSRKCAASIRTSCRPTRRLGHQPREASIAGRGSGSNDRSHQALRRRPVSRFFLTRFHSKQRPFMARYTPGASVCTNDNALPRLNSPSELPNA